MDDLAEGDIGDDNQGDLSTSDNGGGISQDNLGQDRSSSVAGGPSVIKLAGKNKNPSGSLKKSSRTSGGINAHGHDARQQSQHVATVPGMYYALHNNLPLYSNSTAGRSKPPTQERGDSHHNEKNRTKSVSSDDALGKNGNVDDSLQQRRTPTGNEAFARGKTPGRLSAPPSEASSTIAYIPRPAGSPSINATNSNIGRMPHRNDSVLPSQSHSIVVGPQHQAYQDPQQRSFVMPPPPASSYPFLAGPGTNDSMMIPGHQRTTTARIASAAGVVPPGYSNGAAGAAGSWQNLVISSAATNPYSTMFLNMNQRQPHSIASTSASFHQHQQQMILNEAARKDSITAMLLARGISPEEQQRRLGIPTVPRNSNGSDIVDPMTSFHSPPMPDTSILNNIGYPTDQTRPAQRRRLGGAPQMATTPYQQHHLQNAAFMISQPHQQTTAAHYRTNTTNFINPVSANIHDHQTYHPDDSTSPGKTPSKPRVFKSFQERLQDLMKFKERHGHCNVPRRYGPDKSLGVWCNNIRYSYRQLQEGKHPHNSISEDDIRRLDEIGFQWKLKSNKDNNSVGTPVSKGGDEEGPSSFQNL